MKKGRKINDGFGSYISSIRERLGLTLKNVENITGISASYLNRIERGERKCVSIPILENLARCYGRPATEFIEVALNIEQENDNKAPIFEAIIYANDFEIAGRIATKETKDAIIALVRDINAVQCGNNNRWNEYAMIMESVDNLKRYLG